MTFCFVPGVFSKKQAFSSSSFLNENRYVSVEFPVFLIFTERRKCSEVLLGKTPQSNIFPVPAVVGMTTNNLVQPLSRREVSQMTFTGHLSQL